MAEFMHTHRGRKAILYERISALFEQFKEGQYSLNIKLDYSLSTCAFVVFIACQIELISWQIDLVIVISNVYDVTLCNIKIFMQKLIMRMSSLVDHGKAQSLPFQTKFDSCKSGEYFWSFTLTIFLL